MPVTHPARRMALLGLVGLLVACVPVTVNISFPQEKLEGAAGNIEDMVRSPENPQQPAQPKKPGPGSRLADRLLAALGPGAAEAQGSRARAAGVPEIKTRTPELMQAIESRRDRRPPILEWKGKGCIGENNQGLLEARPGQGCTGDVAALIAAENKDRTYIMDTLMQQNNIPASDAPRVREAFAKVHRERVRPGEWVQEPDGRWVKT
jgi:uncharacterized protein YdbL (DUF1318 family)